MLSVDDVRVNYGHLEVLHGVSIEVGEGEVVALLGANGSGKSTLIRACCGLLRPRSGSIRFANHDVGQQKLHEVIRLGLAYCVEGRRTFAQQSVMDNLVLGAYTKGGLNERTRPRFEAVLALFPMLKDKLAQPAGMLSGGQRQMLAVAQALMSQPKLLVLDEPSAGLAPVLVSEMFTLLRQLKEQGMSLLLAEQAVGHALALADRGYVLEVGHVVLEDTAEALQSDPAVRAAYMGGANPDD
jgi:branched-chain amino acid transport system ATP-binding protein